MTPSRPKRLFKTTLALGLSLGAPAVCYSQVNPGNANLSTGSGAGTSPGVNPGSSPSGFRTGTTGPGGIQVPSLAPRREPLPEGYLNRPGLNPGGGLDPVTGLPSAFDSAPMAQLTQAEIDAIDARMLDDVRKITLPADRAAAMDRAAKAKISSHAPGDNRLAEAHTLLVEGTEAATKVEDQVTRDIRMTNLVRTGLVLADELARDGMTDATESAAVVDKKPWTSRRRFELFQKAESERLAAGELAAKITSPTLRSEMLSRVVENTSTASQNLAQQALLADGKRSDLRGMTDMVNRMADRSLIFAANTSSRIHMAIWRDRAMVAIAVASAASEQFDRGIEICQSIPQPGYRGDALIRLAEAQARLNLNGPATKTYSQAAEAVASISSEDPRAILASVLIDSLIAVGRFQDARACIPLYPDDVRKLAALGAVAETQGERRLTASAYAWIDREASPDIRDQLRLRVSTGVLRAYENNRNNTSGSGFGQYGTR